MLNIKQPIAELSQSRGRKKRQELVDIGTEIFTQKGFTITSLDELVAIAGIPKGSFYYYFDSKEEFALEVIRNYGKYFSKKLTRILANDKKSPINRLKEFVTEASAGVKRYEFKRGCLIGNLGQEMASLEDGFRTQLLEVIKDWRNQFAECIEESKKAGEILTKLPSTELSRFFWSAWEGAVLCSKLEQSVKPLKNVGDLFINEILKPNIQAKKK